MVVKQCNEIYPKSNEFTHLFDNYTFSLSDFQKYAIEGISKNNHVLVTAHTGSGKTLPAEFAIQHFCQQKKKVIYTSPIKALSNQKFSEFTRKFKEDNISLGLLTGDIKINPEADVLIMTTEILMNYLFLQTNTDLTNVSNCQLQFQIDLHKDLGCVIFDEIHYINDQERGQTWEKTILMLPSHIPMVMLSATIDAPTKFAQWIYDRHKNKDVYVCSTDKRVVPLTHYGFLTVNEGSLKSFQDKALIKDIKDHTNRSIQLQSSDGVFEEDGFLTLKRIYKKMKENNLFVKRKQVLNSVCKYLRKNSMLPAICFVFSRKLVEICANEITVPLFEEEDEERFNISKECESIVRKLPNYKEYLELPEYIQLVRLLEKGIGIHHSGMIPILREIVEIMISKKYIYLLFATESFAIGLDCPIKTAVFSSLTKFDGHHERFVYGHEYTQMAGRAGRRGIDTLGHVVHLNNLFSIPLKEEYSTILKGKPQQLVSKFRISYELVLNLLKNGKTKECDFREFASNSMIQKELDTSKENTEQQIKYLDENCKEKREQLTNLKSNDLEEYYKCLNKLQDKLSNNQKKKIENQIQTLKQNKSVRVAIDLHEDLEKLECDYKKEKDHLEYYEYFIEDSVGRICDLLIHKGFVDKQENEYSLLKPGIIASNLAEVHPIIMSLFLHTNYMMEDLSVDEIIGLFSLFTDVNINREFKIEFPRCSNDQLYQLICELNSLVHEYEDLENEYHIDSGIDYSDLLTFDMPDLALQWISYDNEYSCKEFLLTINQDKGISAGDFTKAMLKISTIAREIAVICEMFGEISCLQKLKQVDEKILKFITTCQSLYV